MRLAPSLALFACVLPCLGSPALAQDTPAKDKEPPARQAANQPEALAGLVVTGRVQARFGGAEGPCVSRFVVEGLVYGEGPSLGEALFVVGDAPLPEGKPLRLSLSWSRDEGYRVIGCEEASGEPSAPSPVDVGALRALAAEMISATQTQNWKALAGLVLALKLQDPQAFFSETFGAGPAAALSEEYAETSKGMVVDFRATLSAILDEGGGPFTVFQARGFHAIGLQRRATFAMEQDVPLYTIRFDRAGVGLWSFAWVEGSWRYLGKLQALPREPLVLSVRLSHTSINAGSLAEQRLVIAIKNASEEVVEVPTVYDGRVVRLIGRGRDHFWSSRLRLASPPAQRLVRLEPKAERVLLEVSLSELLGEQATTWSWDWGAHPVPPQSPIHRWRELGLERDVVFYVAAEAGARTLHSKPLRVAVVPQ